MYMLLSLSLIQRSKSRLTTKCTFSKQGKQCLFTSRTSSLICMLIERGPVLWRGSLKIQRNGWDPAIFRGEITRVAVHRYSRYTLVLSYGYWYFVVAIVLLNSRVGSSSSNCTAHVHAAFCSRFSSTFVESRNRSVFRCVIREFNRKERNVERLRAFPIEPCTFQSLMWRYI